MGLKLLLRGTADKSFPYCTENRRKQRFSPSQKKEKSLFIVIWGNAKVQLGIIWVCNVRSVRKGVFKGVFILLEGNLKQKLLWEGLEAAGVEGGSARRHPGLALMHLFPTQLCILCTGEEFVDIFILASVIRHIFNAHIYAEKQISTRKILPAQKLIDEDKLVFI